MRYKETEQQVWSNICLNQDSIGVSSDLFEFSIGVDASALGK